MYSKSSNQRRVFITASVLWAVAIAFVKLSILAFYLLLFRNPVIKNVTYVLAGLFVSLMVAVVLAALLVCRPLAFNWNRSIRGTCGDTHGLYLSGGIIILILDISIVALPMPMLWGLQVYELLANSAGKPLTCNR